MIFRTLLILSFYTLAYFIINYIKYKGYYFNEELKVFYFTYIFSTFLSSIIVGKFGKTFLREFNSSSKILIKSFVLNLGLITILVNFRDELINSRLLIVGSLTLGFLFEFIYIVLYSKFEYKTKERKAFSFSVLFLIIEFIILTWVTFYSLVNYQFPDYSYKQKILFIIILYTIWFVSSSINRHTDISKGTNLVRIVWNHLVSYLLLFLIVSSMLFLLALPIEIKKVVYYNLILFSFWSLIALGVFYLYRSKPKIDQVTYNIFNSTEFPDDYEIQNEVVKVEESNRTVKAQNPIMLKEQLKNIYLKNFKNEFEFIDQNLELKNFDLTECVVLRSSDMYNIEVLPSHSIALYMNLHELNDFKSLNDYFVNINYKLKKDGYFIGRFQTNQLRHEMYHKKYPFYIANFYYSIDFLWKRVFPKLPVLKRFHAVFSNGRNRSLSMAEGLGRLYYCGFKVKNVQIINNHLYFIAKKDREPISDKNPSYGLLFKMKRIGKNGKLIYVYKLRTMHPYSEYLQKFVYDNFNLKEGGKFENDFRITSWGRIARKLWIDELPMLINLFKGELKIVGIRPLSLHYLSLYDPKFVEFRNKFKPGLIPPFYADMPKTLEEIQESEKVYLDNFSKSKLGTDINYLFKAFRNIFFRNARSA